MTTIIHFNSCKEALAGSNAPADVLESLCLVNVQYQSFDKKTYSGQLVVHKDLAQETIEMFKEIYSAGFPISKIVPIAAYGWDDEKSMQDNNTSAFNYRKIIGTDTVSNHSLGRAIDINPLLNPYYAKDGNTYPVGSVYDPGVYGTITGDSDIVSIFKNYEWTWLGDRKENADYQHFEKSAG